MKLYKLAWIAIISGIMLLGYAVLIGDAHVALLLIFPVIYGKGVYSLIGIFLIIMGIFLFFLSPLEYMFHGLSSREIKYSPNTKENVKKEKNIKYGGVILLGPIPIVFGSDRNMVTISVLVGILMILCILLFYLFYIH